MSDPPCQGDAVELVRAQIEALSELQPSMEALQGTLKAVLEVSKELVGQMEPQASLFIQSETQMLSQGVARLDGALALRLRQLQEELDLLQEFHRHLQFLEQHLRDFESRLTRTSSQDHNPKALQTDLLQLTALTSDLDALNQLGRAVVLSDGTARRLRDLGAQWALASSDAMVTCCELQAGALWRQSLQQKCESWRCFLQSVEENLPKENVLGRSPDPLPRQLTAHREFQVRVSIGSQILNSVIVEALDLLDRGEVEDRYGLIRKLAQQTGRWQGTVERAWQRGALLQGLMGQQQVYAHGLRTLRRLLSDTDHLLSPTGGPAHYSLHQLHQSLQEHKHAEKQFWQHQGLYLRTLEAGGALVSAGATAMQAQLQDELRALREAWERAQGILRERRILTEAVLQNWECCQTRLADSRHRLEELKDRLKQPLPELLEELQITEQLTKEDEKSLEEWHHGLAQPANERVELVRHISPDDMALLQEREEGLRSQWEELCLKVSLCKQETADRLDTWTVFKEKKKQLCNWLTRFESEVAHSGHLTAEETAERLNKDYMEELNFFSENKTHLKQLGERLIRAGDRAKEAVVKDMLKDVDDQWQHTTGCVESRMRQLQQRQDRVQELHRTVSGLRTQLSRTEANLATPLLYSECHSREIQRRLAEQQGLEQDVEQQSEGIAAVQALCDLLAWDADDVETASMRESTLSLDRRLRNIRTLTAQRKSRINETQRLWREFLDDHEHFKDWLRTAEQTAAHPDSGPILYTAAKEEVKKFEALQREVQERLAPLELLNVRYRRLARENRTDTAGSLKVTVHEGNQRWDALQQRTTAILRRLKDFTSQWEEFDVTKERTIMWLVKMDLRLTDVEHFSEGDAHNKMEQLEGLRQEISLGSERISQLTAFGERLIQRSVSQDGVLIQDQLSNLRSDHQQLVGRAARFYQRLIQSRPASDGWPELSVQASSHLLTLAQEQSGGEIQDAGGFPSHEGELEATACASASGTSVTEPSPWPSPEPQETISQGVIPGLGASPTQTPRKQGYAELVSECSGSIDHVKRVSLILDDVEEPAVEQGLPGLAVADKQSGVIQRWEVLQAMSPQCRVPHDPPQPTSDLSDIIAWLSWALPELEQLQGLEPTASVHDMETSVNRLKAMQRTFDTYKGAVIALNLSRPEPQQGAEGGADAEGLRDMNQAWVKACALLEQWEERLRSALLRCQEFHQTLQSLLLWVASAESQRLAVNVQDPALGPDALREHGNTLTGLERELQAKQQQVGTLQAISTQLLREGGAGEEDSDEPQEKLHVISHKLQLLLHEVAQDQRVIQERLEQEGETAAVGQPAENRRPERRDRSPPRSFFHRVLRAAFPLHLLLLLLLTLACLVPAWEEDYRCTQSNNFGRSLYPMLHYTNGPPPT
ncbi:hypothetical protein AAFF_G00203500 [Aldrovandia affinis]|uniref:KASH domain-containing protein n=1 Tax=Aldrovandia affinis TaxID=143900 RepID=A0AAD7WW22_9TELE|nr:hypothetical protein AAFF_G00203500 [Aldrovandia affinis]